MRDELESEFGRYLTYPQAAQVTTASVRTLKRLTQAGELPCYQIGRTRTLRLRTADVAALIRQVA
ncbi:helix-turn-helix domain-containing protein [Aestuariimicrobium sp. Y1814]|uniref:helix-turn-helix domain-containing protein n=1 Tax=Aestuariimicrobium sp. Y1814 TaxID=3418742 RepID=UPI003DA77599